MADKILTKKSRTYSELLRDNAVVSKHPQKKDEPEYVKKEKSINYCVKDGLFSSIKSGLTDSYIMPFAIAMNASSSMLAALASIPQLVASFFQLYAQESLSFFKTRSRLIVWTALAQSLMWLPLIFIPFIAKGAVWLIILFATLEVTLATFQGPIYNSILGDIISDDKRGEFFGKRNRVTNLINFISTITAGLLLDYFKGLNNGVYYVFFGFAIIFFLAFISRAVAAYYKSKIYDPVFKPAPVKVTFTNFVMNMTKHNYGIFVIYVFLFKLATSISAPFFALFLLRDMHLNYLYFTAIMGISIVASFLSMTLWGRLIDKHGSKLVLTISGFLVPLSPFLMIIAIYFKNPLYAFIFIFIEEAFSGAAWAGFNLSTSSFLFDATKKDERIKFIGYYNFLAGIAVFIGAILGGFLINIFPVWIVSAIPFIYLVSGVLRMLSTIIMIKRVREARMVEIDMPGRGFFHRIISIHPHFGANIEIVGVYHPKDSPYKKGFVKKRKPIDPVKKDERPLYEKKSFDYYKEKALKTLFQGKEEPPKDDSAKIEKRLEDEKKKVAEMTEQIRKEAIKNK